jgi:hypothetical protein
VSFGAVGGLEKVSVCGNCQDDWWKVHVSTYKAAGGGSQQRHQSTTLAFVNADVAKRRTSREVTSPAACVPETHSLSLVKPGLQLTKSDDSTTKNSSVQQETKPRRTSSHWQIHLRDMVK